MRFGTVSYRLALNPTINCACLYATSPTHTETLAAFCPWLSGTVQGLQSYGGLESDCWQTGHCRHRFPPAEAGACVHTADVHGDTLESTPNAANAVPSGSLYLPNVESHFKIRDVLQNSSMLNCVRFGIVAGRERAVVAGQNGVAYFFELPSCDKPDAHVPVRSIAPLCF